MIQTSFRFFPISYQTLNVRKLLLLVVNLVLDIEKEKRGDLARTHRNALKIIRDFSENLGLTDIWRLLNPEARRYTWRQNQPTIYCRLDFFLVSESSLCDVTHADILPGFKTKQNEDDTSVNPVLLWEMIKLKVQEKSISYAAHKKRQQRIVKKFWNVKSLC